MTNNEINAAIAEACGWKHVRAYHWKNPNGLSMFEWDMFDYCNDLNAMHEAEKVLTQKQITDYVIEVMQFLHEPMLSTARQRAEAFLRTLGKWKTTDKEFLTVEAATTEKSSVDHLRDATKMMEVQP